MPVDTPAAPAPSSSSPSAAAANAPGAGHRHDDGGYKETVQSILVAFILAFIFRAFIMEAFVIPTGSMAPTLLGAHMRYTCVDCGYAFDVNYSGRTNGDDVEIPNFAPGMRESEVSYDARNNPVRREVFREKVYAVHCPNCGFQVPRSLPDQPANDATSPPVFYGDRILVLKYLWIFGNGPQRWDVVVFKSPDDQSPGQPRFSMNFIKRLIGRPGETVVILDGDIYVGDTRAAGAELGDEDLANFKVQTKPPVIQDALWRVVYDNDYLPVGRAGGRKWRQPWRGEPGSRGWDVGAEGNPSRVFTFDGAAGAGAIAFDPESNPGQHSFTDWLPYDVTVNQGFEHRADTFDTGGFTPRRDQRQHGEIYPANNVSDVKLALDYRRTAGDGPLRLQLTKLGHAFTAEITPGRVRLFHRDAAAGNPDAPPAPPADEDPGRVVAEAALNLPAGKDVRLEFTNVDYRVALRVGGAEAFGYAYAPDVLALLEADRRDGDEARLLPKPRVRIAAEGHKCELSHVSLWRDVYYMNHDARGGRLNWGTPDEPVRLGDDEYFVLGDNALISGDARYWSKPVRLPREGIDVEAGRVPGRFMLGKAFFVYWPAGYRPFTQSAPGLIPNFGDMRFIH